MWLGLHSHRRLMRALKAKGGATGAGAKPLRLDQIPIRESQQVKTQAMNLVGEVNMTLSYAEYRSTQFHVKQNARRAVVCTRERHHPTLNEAANLPHVFARLPFQELFEVILVDGHSTDDTVEVARTLWPSVRVVLQDDTGKGNALACGFAAAVGTSS